jgi:superfamily II DNA or RNA helicase
LAPYRLGLTATPERTDGKDRLLEELIGPTLYRRDIVELSGNYLAQYDTIRIRLELTPDERCEYEKARTLYLEFLKRHQIRMSSMAGWSQFIIRASQSPDGHAALVAHRRQRQLAFAASAKFECVENLLRQHRADRSILFTQDNATTYELSRRFLIPAITHQTKITERSEILAGLTDGTYRAIVTSKVLNEGIDVPSANVAIVVSGSSSVREHVQRLGRVLRKNGDKRAVLYELVTAKTNETLVSNQRRDHSAYR